MLCQSAKVIKQTPHSSNYHQNINNKGDGKDE
jgi:hypothetical protein